MKKCIGMSKEFSEWYNSEVLNGPNDGKFVYVETDEYFGYVLKSYEELHKDEISDNK